METSNRLDLDTTDDSYRELCVDCGTYFVVEVDEDYNSCVIHSCCCGECVEKEDIPTCSICGADARDSSLAGYCQKCIDISDEAQDRRDNSSCYTASI